MKLKNVMVIFLILLAGCAYIDQSLKVNPTVSIAPSDIGGGKQISVQIIDDREEQFIGKRVNGYGMSGAKITTDQDLVETLKEPIYSGLTKKGFAPVNSEDILPRLRTELRSLSYDTATGLWTAGNIGKTTIKIIATNTSGKTFEKTYRGQKEIRTVFIGSQETNSKVVNEAFGDAIGKIFNDEDMLKFLAEK
jgi:uncharacterized lipoprotein